MIRTVLIAALIALASCAGTSSGLRFTATGSLTGDVRTDGAGTWVAIGEADLVIAASLSPSGPIVFVPVHVARGRVWAIAPDGTTLDQPLGDPLPPWAAALYAPGELAEILGGLTPALPAP